MGSMYDVLHFENNKGQDVEMQFKNGDCIGQYFNIGDEIHLEDGIYFCSQGAFVVLERMVRKAFTRDESILFDKWGNRIEYPKLKSPVEEAMEEVITNNNIKGDYLEMILQQNCSLEDKKDRILKLFAV